MYHCYFGTHIGHEKCLYTKCVKKGKINYFNIPRNKPLIVLDYWSKKIEEDFHLRNHDNINISEKSTTQYMINVMNRMMKHFNSI